MGRKNNKRRCSVQGCNEPHRGLGYCNAHYLRLVRNGNPLAGGTNRGKPLSWLDDAIFSNSDECIPWPFARTKGAAANVKFNGRTMAAHRLVCIIAHGEPPTDRHQAAHSCGMGHEFCVNRKHLRWATNKENQGDRKIHSKIRGPEAVALVF